MISADNLKALSIIGEALTKLNEKLAKDDPDGVTEVVEVVVVGKDGLSVCKFVPDNNNSWAIISARPDSEL